MFLPRKYLLVVADPSSSHPGTLSVVVPALRALAAACDDIPKVTRVALFVLAVAVCLAAEGLLNS
jgi:hypothetical protein